MGDAGDAIALPDRRRRPRRDQHARRVRRHRHRLAVGALEEVDLPDRLPRRDRVIDLSRGAARQIGLIGPGTARVRLEVVR